MSPAYPAPLPRHADAIPQADPFARILAPTAIFLLSLVCGTLARAEPTLTAVVPLDDPEARRAQGQVALAPLSDVANFDPGREVTSVSQFWLGHVFEGLTTYDAKGAVVPAAARAWEVSADGKVVTFRLRKGLAWHDGTPLTAEDFAYAWRRLATPAYASEYSFILKTARISGATEVLAGTKPPEALGVKAIDASTLRVELDGPSALLPDLLTLNVFFPVRRDLVERHGAKFGIERASIMGNGPFALASWVPEGAVVLARAPTHRDTTPAAGVRSIVLPFASSSFTTAWQSYRTGRIDLFTNLDADHFRLASQAGEKVESVAAGAQWYLLFNQRPGTPFADPALREAVAASIDGRAYIGKVHALPGAKQARGLVPEFVLGSSLVRTFRSEFPVAPEKPNPARAKALVEASVEKAKKAAGGGAAAGTVPERVIRFVGVGNESNKVEAEWFQAEIGKALAPLGAKVTLDLPPFKVRMQKVADGDFDVAMASWIPDYNDPLTFLEIFETGAEANAAKWSDPAFDTLLAKVRALPRGTPRSRLLREAEERLLAARVVFPYRQSARLFVVRPGLEGVRRRPMGIDPDLRYARWEVRPNKGTKRAAPAK